MRENNDDYYNILHNHSVKRRQLEVEGRCKRYGRRLKDHFSGETNCTDDKRKLEKREYRKLTETHLIPQVAAFVAKFAAKRFFFGVFDTRPEQTFVS